MKAKLYIFIILYAAVSGVYAQRPDLETVMGRLKTSKKDVGRVQLLMEASSLLGEQSDFTQAVKYAEQSLQLAQELGYKEGEANAYASLGLLYQYTGDYDKAIQYSLDALRLFEESNNKKQITNMISNIGNVYLNQKNFKKAEEYYLRALPRDTASAMAHCNLGLLYTYMKEYSKAFEHYNSASQICEKKGSKIGAADVYTNMGLIYYDLKDFVKALDLHLKALGIYETHKDRRRLNISYENLGGVYFELKDYKRSEEYLNKALELAKEIGDKEGVQVSAAGLVELYYKTKEYKKAYEFDLLSNALKDSLLNEESGKMIAEMNTKYESEKKDKELLKKDAEISKQEARSRQQTIIIISAIAGIILAAILGLFILRSYREKQRTNIEISHQKAEIELKNKEIIDSIHYAQRIQGALLAGNELLKNNLKEYFVLYKPKDIVSGDFYWAHRIGNKFLLCTADCTGHGVPGAFMSLLNISFLNEVTTEKKITQPDKVLNQVRDSIIATLNTEGNEESKDGMDCTLCCFDLESKKLEYAAANNSFYLVRDGELILQPADKMPVGKSPRDTIPFTHHALGLKEGDMIYTLTDGYPDQFGGPKGKKFKYKALEELLLANHRLPLKEQSKILEHVIASWKGSLEQVDDILIIGVRITNI